MLTTLNLAGTSPTPNHKAHLDAIGLSMAKAGVQHILDLLVHPDGPKDLTDLDLSCRFSSILTHQLISRFSELTWDIRDDTSLPGAGASGCT